MLTSSSSSSSSSLSTLLLLIVINLFSSSTISSFKGVGIVFVSATIQCTVGDDGDNGNKLCEEKYRKGSYCTSQGICSNPFHKGCLQAVLPQNFTKLRVCNSDDYDSKETKEEGLFCRPANEQFDYEEVRILSQNWESAMFSSWIMQIVLSELLNVPATIETSMSDNSGSSFNFYDPELRFSYSKESYVSMKYDYDALRTALELTTGDCKSFQKKRRLNDLEYISCAHVMPEVWNGQYDNIALYEKDNIIESATGSGGVGKFSWYIPKFTAERNPLLLSYFGMTTNTTTRTTIVTATFNTMTSTAATFDIIEEDASLKTRRLLAETFLRPQTWNDFCLYVSTDNCTTPYYDNEKRLIASSPPPPLSSLPDNNNNNNNDDVDDNDDGNKYFVTGSYNGHFAPTDDNDCDSNPTTCTGHIVNPPCDWTTFVIPQAYYNHIPVTSSGLDDQTGGYSHRRMVEIYHAANYTKSDILFYWFTPDALQLDYVGTNAEFQRVLLPPASQECTQSRVTEEQRCSSDPKIRIGNKEGSCDTEAHSLQTLIVSDMRTRYYQEENIKETMAMRSPAYDTIKNMKISDLWLDNMFKKWVERDIDRSNYDPREAVCTWVGENIEILQRFIPPSYPRSINIIPEDQPIIFVAVVVGVLSTFFTIVVAGLTYRYRTKKVMLYAQPNFLYIIILGLFSMCFSTILYATPPSKGTCMARYWFVLLGSSLQLIPLIVKIAAIKKIFRRASKFKRVRIRIKKLFMTVAIFIGGVVLYLLFWTIFDPSTKRTISALTDNFDEENKQIVDINYACASNSPVWLVVSYLYNFLLLSAATVLAFESHKVKQEFNESSHLAFVIYSQFLVLLLRGVIWMLGARVKAASNANAYISILLSLDVFTTICIYFVPKIMQATKPQKDQRPTLKPSFKLGSSKLGCVESIRISAAKEMQDWSRKMERLEQLEKLVTHTELTCSEFSCPSCNRRISFRDESLLSIVGDQEVKRNKKEETKTEIKQEFSEENNDTSHVNNEQDDTGEETITFHSDANMISECGQIWID